MIGFDGMGRIVRNDTTPVQDSLIRIIGLFTGGWSAHMPSVSQKMRKEAEGLIKNGFAIGPLNEMRLTKKGQARLERLQKIG